MNRLRKIASWLRIDPPGVAMPGPRLTNRIRTIISSRSFARISRIRFISLFAVCSALSVVFLAVTLTRAQDSVSEAWEKAAGGKMSFEVASVKPNPSGPGPVTMGGFGQQPGGLIKGVNVPLYWYIAFAYKLDPAQQRALHSQMPSWAQKDRFDIEARIPNSGLTTDQRRLMMQSLLAQRFRLVAHFETKDGLAYALVLAKGGKLGSQMRTYPDGFPCSDELPPSGGGRGGGPAPTESTVDDGRLPASCGRIHNLSPIESEADHRSGRNIDVNTLLEWISQVGNLDRPLVDRTGLSGTFDVSVEFALAPLPDAGAAAEPRETAFLAAVSDQLGLKLEPTTAPVRSLVIDHIEEPTPN